MRRFVFSCSLFVFLFMAHTVLAGGDIQITCEPEVRIWLNNDFKGTTTSDDNGMFIEGLPPGDYNIKATKTGFGQADKLVTVLDGQTVEVEIQFTAPDVKIEDMVPEKDTAFVQEVGTFILRSVPLKAIAYIDDKEIGETDKKVRNFPVGHHTVKFVFKGKTLTDSFKLNPNETLKLKGHFKKGRIITESTGPAVAEESAAPAVAAEPTGPAVVEESAAPAVAAEPTGPVVVEESAAPAVVAEPTGPAVVEESAAPAVVAEPTGPVVIEKSAAPAVIAEPIGSKAGGQFIKYKTGVVKNTQSGLEWVAGPDRNTKWDDAQKWIESLNVDGGGWRMPTGEELRTLYQKDTGTRNLTPLLETTGWYIWSGETKGASSAWFFYFGGGYKNWCSQDASYDVRAFAVRSRR
ncbi:DUF1566 domain-containing protein [Thermodesulfobacteriota bacterium]